MRVDKLRSSVAAKTTAIILFVIMGLALAASITGIVVSAEYNVYFDYGRTARNTVMDGLTSSKSYWLYEYYFGTSEDDSNWPYVKAMTENLFSEDSSNMGFVIKDDTGTVLAQNFTVEDYQYSKDYNYQVEGSAPLLNGRYTTVEETEVTVTCYVKSALTAPDDIESNLALVNLGISMRYWLIVIAVFSLLFEAVSFVYLMCAAGFHKGVSEPRLIGLSKAPLELLLAGALAIGSLPMMVYDWAAGYGNSISQFMVMLLCGMVWLLLAILICMSFAARCKCARLWKTTLTYFILRIVVKTARSLWSGFQYVVSLLPMAWKTALALFGLSFVEFIVMVVCFNSYSFSALVFWWFAERVVLIPAAILFVVSLKKLQMAGERLAGGDMTYKVDLKHMQRDLKVHGENLNSISEGISKAVDERMKSERFKAELITNVSHDIKTPLTSIVNYVDLLKRETNTPQQTAEYLSILDKQSSKLKKLTEDLVEASKAASGSIQVNLQKTEAGILLSQTVGEYEERMRKNGLELILTKPEAMAYILCDGKLLWRVFDNLLNNICKYAQENTRVYLNLVAQGNTVSIIFKNISKYELNISSEELMERFTRGDRSRNTEGSGLGISIAKNLTELQNGQFALSVDGDLFKVTLTFERVQQGN